MNERRTVTVMTVTVVFVKFLILDLCFHSCDYSYPKIHAFVHPSIGIITLHSCMEPSNLKLKF